jgi:hypothetical protein
MDRTSFYEWKRRFQTHGFDGLKDLPPIHKSHPQTTSEAVVQRLLALAMEHPAYGWLQPDRGTADAGRGTGIGHHHPEDPQRPRAGQRWLALEARNAEQAIVLSQEQIDFLEKQNPCFRERHVESSRPGELLCQDTFFVGT